MVSDLVVIPILLVTLGFAGVYTGWKRRRIHAQMTQAPTKPVRELASPETVEIEGQALPAAEPVTAPVTGRDAALAAWKVEEWDERGDTEYWREVARGIEVPRLEVDDDTGTVAVDPVSKRDTAGKWTQTTGVSASDGVRIGDVLAEFDQFPVQTTLGPDETPPDRIRALHDDHGLYEDTGSATNVVDAGTEHGERRYREQVVEPGETMYVRGRVDAEDDPDRTHFRPEDAVVSEPDDGLLILSDQTEASLESEFETTARLRIAGGAVAVALGLVGGYVLLPV